jgi:hypothetical protein
MTRHSGRTRSAHDRSCKIALYGWYGARGNRERGTPPAGNYDYAGNVAKTPRVPHCEGGHSLAACALLFRKRVERPAKATERQRHADAVTAGIGKENFTGAGRSAEFLQDIVLDLEVGEATVGHAARKRFYNAGVSIADLNSNGGAKQDVDRHLHNQLDRLAFHRMGQRDPRKQLVPALDLCVLPHLANFLMRWLGRGLALNDPVAVRRGGALRCLAWRRLLRLRSTWGAGTACAPAQENAGNE